MDFVAMAEQVRRLGAGEVRQIFIRIPGERVLQMSLVQDATWAGLQVYASEGEAVALIDLSSLSGLIDISVDVAKAG